MIKASDGKIGVKELTSIFVLTIGIKFTDATPSFLIEEGKNAAWMMPLISFVLFIGPFLLLLKLIKKHETGFAELIHKLMGKYVGWIILLILFFLIFTFTSINIRSYINIINTMFYQKTPVPFLTLLFLLTIFYVAKRGFEAVGRTAWLFIPWIEATVILLVFFVWREFNWEQIFPIAGPGFTEVMKESAKKSSIFGEAILLAAFFSFVRTYKDFRIASLIGIGLSCFKMSVFLAIYVFVFNYPSVETIAYPYQQLTRMATIGEVVTHIEAVFLAFWSIAAVIHFAIYFYLVAFLLSKLLHIADFESLLLPLIGLTLFLCLIPDNVYQLDSL